MKSSSITLAAVIWSWSFLAPGLAEFPPLALKPVSLQQITSPVSVSHAGDGSKRLFVCDQAGKIWVVRDEMVLPVPFLDLAGKLVPKAPTSYPFPLSTNYDERGLLGLAFHPNYNQRDINNLPLPGFGKFYVFYSAPSPNVQANPTAPATTPVPVNCRTVISEYQVTADANVANPNSERILLSFDKPQSNHNGGQLEFGPDGYLYFSAGDGGGANDRDLGHNGATNPATPRPCRSMCDYFPTTSSPVHICLSAPAERISIWSLESWWKKYRWPQRSSSSPCSLRV